VLVGSAVVDGHQCVRCAERAVDLKAHHCVAFGPPRKLGIIHGPLLRLRGEGENRRRAVRIEAKDTSTEVLGALIRAPITSASESCNCHSLLLVVLTSGKSVPRTSLVHLRGCRSTAEGGLERRRGSSSTTLAHRRLLRLLRASAVRVL
jgi:hypothetical protein